MQQTSKYQFKLIEGTDDFSPTPLNDNMEKVEEKFTAVEDDLAQLTQRVGINGKTARFVFGSYTGTGACGEENKTSLSFDFVPVIVLMRGSGDRYTGVFIRGSYSGGSTATSSATASVTWSEHGLTWYNAESPDYQNNSGGSTYSYVAIGYDD